MKAVRRIALWSAAALTVATMAFAHVGNHPSIHDVMASIIERLRTTVPADSLVKFRQDDILRHMTPDERHVMATEYWSFAVDRPVTVTIFRALRQPVPPYWLAEHGFTTTGDTALVRHRQYEAWTKDFDAGRIGLGIHGFSDHGDHYFVVLTPKDGGKTVEVSQMYPGSHTVASATPGTLVYPDTDSYILESVPERLEGDVLLTTRRERSKETELTGLFRVTDYPSTTSPTDVVLTWSEDPKTTQTVQWRTSTEVTDGVIKYRAKGGRRNAEYTGVPAGMSSIRDEFLLNDPVSHRFSGVIRGLTPGTTYEYIVGSPTAETWSEPSEFTTAPGEVVPFKFVYMGDAQNGLDTWGELVRKSFVENPDAMFYVMAGDLVTRGNERQHWDSFFHNGADVFGSRPIVPALGNHECQGRNPWMYIRLFTLAENGPHQVPPERAYAFEYSNAIFLVLDSNLDPADQADWIADQLENTDATWKFVVYHHPAYSSGPRRDNPEVREIWGALFDRYHVDLALQGHDHAYLRTYPMHGGERVDSPDQGTIYIVSVSGTKMYAQAEGLDYREVGFTNISTYQVLDVTIDGDRLDYKAYDFQGNVKDELVIEK